MCTSHALELLKSILNRKQLVQPLEKINYELIYIRKEDIFVGLSNSGGLEVFCFNTVENKVFLDPGYRLSFKVLLDYISDGVLAQREIFSHFLH